MITKFIKSLVSKKLPRNKVENTTLPRDIIHSTGNGWSETLEPSDTPWHYHTLRGQHGELIWQGQYDLYPLWKNFGIPDDLSGQTVLDIGTGSGFFAFECEKRGASRVVATELAGLSHWDSRRNKTYSGTSIPEANRSDYNSARALLNSSVELMPLNISDTLPEQIGQFDIVIFGSLMTHIMDPVRALTNLRSLTKKKAVIISSYLPGETKPCLQLIQTPRPFDWWVPAKCLIPEMLKAVGFSSVVETGDFILKHQNGDNHSQACWHATP
ncbi:class I SAM-dependent methyltransferase [Maridesulfovibrio frigidus]|uniref:class I SAM-dependent methyltransferase n=1 Tax=Maridesulfovibrio frigidus TaxID=340956 RepID=UPI0004E26F80|nr:methyltransferase domain-containing protein [Maridesulfovibrio frigidus]